LYEYFYNKNSIEIEHYNNDSASSSVASSSLMATSAVYILDLKGKHLISRDYRGDIPNNVIDKFVKHVVKADEESSIKPVFEDGGYSFAHVKYSNLYCMLY
jgi:hypothetical protein